jgi:hypothetical protein
MQPSTYIFARLPRAALAALLFTSLLACKMTNDTLTTVLPRNQDLPLFKPHIPTFICAVEASKVPPVDAQADAWFLEARALESPEIYVDNRNYKKIVQLTLQAAERRHWKAMLNLASLYLERRDPPHGVEDAVKLVEEAMLLGIPAAYDRMGTYHMNGTGVGGDATRAYAFWQKAAEMGNPHAMAFLGEKLSAGTDGAIPGYFANIPVAIKMLECALGQGYGPAAYTLHFLYEVPRAANGDEISDRTRETKIRALKVLHEGVKFGCQECARDLAIEFGDPFDLADMLAPHVDKARGERYREFSNALSFDPDDRFPNLDKILPLPPAHLPRWNGDQDTLLNAARGVSPPPPTPKPSAASQSTGRAFLDAAFALRNTGHASSERQAPIAGYWQPTAPQQSERIRAQLAKIPPGQYQRGEAFDHLVSPYSEGGIRISSVVWERWETIRHNHGAVEPHAPARLIRHVARPEPLLCCDAALACPVSGIWQPWVHGEHPLQDIVNRHWRQTWLLAGQPFPQPQRDWLLPLPEQDVTWHLMDAADKTIL